MDFMKALVKKIVAAQGGYREKEIMNKPYIIEQSETWNNDHKVLNVREFVPQPDGHRNGFEVDIVTKTICG